MTLQDKDIQRVYSLPTETLNKARAIASEFEGWPSVIRGMLEQDLNMDPSLARVVEWVLGEDIPNPDDVGCELYRELLASPYRDQTIAILKDSRVACESDESFLGFTDTYKHLAEIIPRHWAVVDIGCNLGFQGWYFRSHARYIGVEPEPESKHLEMKNGTYLSMTAAEFIKEQKELCERPDVFAICNCVPPWYELGWQEQMRATFKNLFVFYPSGDYAETGGNDAQM